MSKLNVLVAGATGYIGGRLVPRLIEAGHDVRCLVRDPGRFRRPFSHLVQVFVGDVLQADTLPQAMEGVDLAYYLVHSMRSGEKGFEQRDQIAAENFATAAKNAGVKRIIYLGGLGSENNLSSHLQSRHEVGEILRKFGPPVTEFRAAIIVGSGSISFEMIRYLTERVPVMICPRWVSTRCQPIAVDDVLRYLVDAVAEPRSADKILEIGGADILTYGEMMLQYAKLRGLTRLLIPVPVLTPRLSSYWVDFVTPIPSAISRPLIEGLRNEVICHDQTALELFPFKPVCYRAAVAEALSRSEKQDVETIWSTPLSSMPSSTKPVELETKEGMIMEMRSLEVATSPHNVFRTFMGIGGRRGWFTCNWAWRLRGLLDRVMGGVGMRRGRRHPDELLPGEALDFWRVEAVEDDHLLRLRAEMKVPGKAWLQFTVEPRPNGRSHLTQTAFFEPQGLLGVLYWYSLYPIHKVIFSRMIRAIGKRSLAQRQVAKSTEHPAPEAVSSSR